VIGCPGSGKSTFSRVLHSITGLPLFYLDRMNWNADRTTVPKSVFLDRLNEAVCREEWIIDGNYGSSMELRMRACDTIVFLDYPPDLCLQGVRERRGKPRADMPWTEQADEEDAGFIEFIRRYNVHSRPAVMELLARYADRDIHVFTSRQEADAFLCSLRR